MNKYNKKFHAILFKAFRIEPICTQETVIICVPQATVKPTRAVGLTSSTEAKYYYYY